MLYALLLKMVGASDLKLECVPKNYISYYSNKTCAVGTQKNRLNETVLMSTKNIC